MRRLAIYVAIMALAACTPQAANRSPSLPAAPAPAVAPGGAMPACALSIAFGSYAMGIDGATRARVEALLVADRGVSGFDTRRWGREGEVTLCVRTRGVADTNRLFRQVRAMVPSRPTGPIRLRTATGLGYETPPR